MFGIIIDRNVVIVMANESKEIVVVYQKINIKIEYK